MKSSRCGPQFMIAVIALPIAATSRRLADRVRDPLEGGRTGPRLGWKPTVRACHSLNYIPMNSPFLDSEAWQGEGGQDDQSVRRRDWRRRRRDDRRLSEEELRHLRRLYCQNRPFRPRLCGGAFFHSNTESCRSPRGHWPVPYGAQLNGLFPVVVREGTMALPGPNAVNTQGQWQPPPTPTVISKEEVHVVWSLRPKYGRLVPTGYEFSYLWWRGLNYRHDGDARHQCPHRTGQDTGRRGTSC